MKTSVEAPDEVLAAVALLDATCSIQRATALFLDRFSAHLGAHQSEVEKLIAGDMDQVSIVLDGLEADISAVVAGDGRRHALLSIPLPELEVPRERRNPLLDEPIDGSPAIIWLKGLDGRYLRVNHAYAQQLRTETDRVCGRTDWELAPGESIDGTRLRRIGSPDEDPLELEYTVQALDDQPAFAVLRFALRDAEGKPIAVCGVASPLAHAEIARGECARLMRIERLSRLDQAGIRRELLGHWELAAADAGSGASPPELSPDERSEDDRAQHLAEPPAGSQLEQTVPPRESELLAELAAVRAELERARQAAADRPSREELEEERARAQRADAALDEERARSAQAEADAQSLAEAREELHHARAEAESASAALAAERTTVHELHGELTALREELERARRSAAERPRSAPPPVPQPAARPAPPAQRRRGGILGRLLG